MTEPSRVITVAPDWQAWHVVVTEPRTAPDEAERALNWRSEAIVAVMVAAYSALLGSAVGLVWPRLSPQIHLAAAINGSEAASKALLGADLWLGLLGLIAGVVSVALLAVVGRDAGRGPGGMVGLAVGGVLGSLVAAQVGHIVQEPHIVSTLHSSFPGITSHSVKTIIGYFGFRLRLKAVLVAWPVAALIVQSASIALRYHRLDAAQRR
jgi:hypothetical protein